jgi:hypothetical protein
MVSFYYGQEILWKQWKVVTITQDFFSGCSPLLVQIFVYQMPIVVQGLYDLTAYCGYGALLCQLLAIAFL